MELRRFRPVIIYASAAPPSYQEFDLFVKQPGERRRVGRLRPGTAAVGLVRDGVAFELVAARTGEPADFVLEKARPAQFAAAMARTVRRLLRRPRSTWRDLTMRRQDLFFWPVRIVHPAGPKGRPDGGGFHFLRRMGDRLLPGAEARIREVFEATGADSVSWDYLVAGEGVLRPVSADALMPYSDAFERHVAFRAEAPRAVAQSGRHVHIAEYLGRSQVMQSWVRKVSVPRAEAGLSVVVPTRDAPALLATCLDSLRRTLRPQDELILVDHRSEHPDALALIRMAEQGGAKVCREAGAFNFSRLVNAGAALATRPGLVMLNNDVRDLNAGWPAIMSGWLDEPGIGAVGVDLRYPDGTRQHVGLALDAQGLPAHLEPGRRTDGPQGLYRVPRTVFAVTGACLGIRTALFRELGGMDEDWPTDFNDVALCLKVRERGFGIVWTPDIQGVHDESASRGRSAVTDAHRADWARLAARHPETAGADPFVSPRIDRRRLEWSEDWGLAAPDDCE